MNIFLKRIKSVILSGVAMIALGVLAGCASRELTGQEGKAFEIAAESTPFYRFGPEQTNGADFMLQRGRIVTLVKPGFGYSEVRTDTGEQGFIATGDMSSTPIPDTPLLPLTMTDPFSPDIGMLPDEQNSAIVEHYTVDDTNDNITLPVPNGTDNLTGSSPLDTPNLENSVKDAASETAEGR